jgi:predicted AAA+ superfamily ATPase
MMERIYYKNIWAEFDNEKAMVLISGGRQTGKTTLAKDIASKAAVSLYFNYDVPVNKAKILTYPAFFEEVDRNKGEKPLIILDEVHKYKEWKNYLKGIYDGYSDGFRFLVTGRGRLDLSQKRGDSLAGRYFHFHLFPFTVGEMFNSSPLIKFQNALQIPAIQLVNSPNVSRKIKNGTNDIIVATAADWLANLK